MNLSSIRDILVIITTIATILGVCIKTLNKFFLETIKCKYKMLPGRQSLFDTILKSIIYIIFAISVIVAFIMVSYTIIRKGTNLNANDLLNLSINIYQLIGFIVVIVFYYLIFGTQKIFTTLQNRFIKKFEGKHPENYDQGKILNNGSNFWLKHIKYIIRKINSISTRKVIIINTVVASFLGIFSTSLIITYIIKGINKEDIESVCILSLICMVGLISFVISISLLDVVEVVHNNYVYEIATEQEIIICRCYLEYDEHYLVLQGGNERYISKGKVKEIKKSKGFQIQI